MGPTSPTPSARPNIPPQDDVIPATTTETASIAAHLAAFASLSQQNYIGICMSGPINQQLLNRTINSKLCKTQNCAKLKNECAKTAKTLNCAKLKNECAKTASSAQNTHSQSEIHGHTHTHMHNPGILRPPDAYIPPPGCAELASCKCDSAEDMMRG